MHRYNFAARAGRWSADHWKTAVAIWVAFVVVAVGLGMTVGTHTLTASEQSTGEIGSCGAAAYERWIRHPCGRERHRSLGDANRR